MYTYWTVEQAILNPDWREKHGHDWCNVRIEVYDGCPYGGSPYAVAEMGVTFRPRGQFPDWVDDLPPSEKQLTVDEIVEMYRESGNQIEVLG